MDRSAHSNLRPLLPATGSRHPEPPIPTRRHRNVACENCRLKKVKCNGKQPVCERCQVLGLECDYAVGPADKSRKAALIRRLGEVEHERDNLRDLLNLIQSRPDDEAREIFRRIRANRDPLMTLQALRQANLLLPNPDPVSQFQGYPQIEMLDAEGSRWSPLKLRARPWTTVAGDGIVSALISKFFAWDGAYVLPFIDRICFVRDMKTGDIAQSQFCSPFLVSAICTLQSHYSDAVKRINTVTGQNMQEAFFLEAQRFLHLENNRASLPTTQGLLVMFMASAFLSRDGAAPMYRSLGYSMIDRLRLEDKVLITEDEQEKLAYCTAAWGFYCCEITIANLHNRRPERHIPTVPRLLEKGNATTGNAVENLDILDQPFTSASYPPPVTPGVLNAACDLSIIQHKIVNYNFEIQEQDIDDSLCARRQQYQSLQTWRDDLPSILRNEENHTPGTVFLSVHFDVIVLLLLRPLNPKAYLFGETTSQDLQIVHCQRIISLVENHFREQMPGDYSIFFLIGLFQVCLALIPSLSSFESAELFTRAAVVLHRTVVDLPGMRQILRGVQAVVWGMKKNFPQGARASFDDLKAPSDSVEVNKEWGFPQLEYLQSEPSVAAEELQGIEGRLGRMIAKWEGSGGQSG